ncbi:ORC1-type DNA replication protein [Candidatus Woesearchaeota archaeon]|nr:ORC1-type DNA replication protein [Candidatus Woesearchaeota archaeon]
MGGKELLSFFENYVHQESIFSDKKALQGSFIPESIKHREDQITQIADILAPSLRMEKPSNLFIYGKTGTGKTVTAHHITSVLGDAAKNKNIPLKILYINCKLKKVADTEYRIVAQLVRELGKEMPPTGLPTDEVYRGFFSALEEEKGIVLLILDEIDQLVKKVGDEILYNLLRINEGLSKTQLSIFGISNDATFIESIDPRVRSSLSEEALVFPPYNAFQLQDILRERSLQAFKTSALQEGVIEKCAAYAAREHGDARRALDLLRVAGEIAERSQSSLVKVEHIDLAEEKIEKDTLLEIIQVQPKQSHAALYAILGSAKQNNGVLLTGEIYEQYKAIITKSGLRPLTQRRISDILGELDMLGIINARVISKGRYGRTREISLSLPGTIIEKAKKMVEESLNLG